MLDATSLAQYVTDFNNGKVYPILHYNENYYQIGKLTHNSNYKRIMYTSDSYTISSGPVHILPEIIVYINNDGTFRNVSVMQDTKIPLEARGLTVRSNESVTNAASSVGLNLLYIRDNYALKSEIPTAQANAASALYLKDTNNVVYQITVGTDGTLSATAV